MTWDTADCILNKDYDSFRGYVMYLTIYTICDAMVYIVILSRSNCASFVLKIEMNE